MSAVEQSRQSSLARHWMREYVRVRPNQSAAANRRPPLRSTCMGHLIINIAFHARGPAVAELGR